MRRSILMAGALAISAVLTAAPAFAADGAFAHDESTGKYGLSWNEKNPRAAEEAALKGCASSQCKVVFRTTTGECGAIAMNDSGKVWGGAKRPSREAAQLAAIENCQKRTGGQCKIRGAECNR
ncbi:MAG TPA: DUF4189 domain-containing protein [Stellaceae bacterium]|jgi:hypothetical protein|nr:DUF4189 domain-containing protein [Stellaceae bacterium]